MSVSPRVEVGDVDVATGLSHRRRRAVGMAIEQATGTASGGWADDDQGARGPGVGVCRYGPGCVALAVAGRSDRAGLEKVRAVLVELRRLAEHELVIDLSEMRDCTPALGRMLGRLRVQRLSAGARVEVHGPPGSADQYYEHPPVGHVATSWMTSWSIWTSPGA